MLARTLLGVPLRTQPAGLVENVGVCAALAQGAHHGSLARAASVHERRAPVEAGGVDVGAVLDEQSNHGGAVGEV